MSIYESLSAERKKLQLEQEVPEWFTTGGYQLFKEKVSYNGATVRETYRRVAKQAAKYAGEEWEEKFFQLMWKGWLALSTPVITNMGTNRGMPVSCSGQFVGDSIESFYENYKEAAILTKHGFGTSGSLDSIRPRGSSISAGGTASGAVPVLKQFVQVMRDVAQGTSRRGAFASYLNIESDDFWEAVDYLNQYPDDLNVGWNISNSFIEKLDSGDEEALKRFKRSLKVKAVTGKGYYNFIDKVNEQNPQMYKDKGLEVSHSNLCVAPETLILTDKGHETISELAGQKVNVWNGEEWSTTTVRQTSPLEPVVQVKADDGSSIDCTNYHKWYVVSRDKSGKVRKTIEKRTHELVVGDELIKPSSFEMVNHGETTLQFAYESGFYSGDGCERGRTDDKHSEITFYPNSNKMHLIDSFSGYSSKVVTEKYTTLRFKHGTLLEKMSIPDSNFTLKSRIEWLAGLSDADGCELKGGESFSITTSSQKFSNDLKLFLQEIGVSCTCGLYSNSKTTAFLPKDSVEYKEVDRKPLYVVRISAKDTTKLLNMGLSCRRLKLKASSKSRRTSSKFVKIESITDHGRKTPVYCFTEPKRHLGVFNGLLTGQCTEIALFNDEDHSFTCVLSSMNLAKFDEWKDTDAVFIATVFLDCVCEDFLQQARGKVGFERSVRFTEKGRALGLGTLGFHTYLQSKMVPLSSLEAHLINIEIFKHLHDETLKASQWMAKEWGEPEWCKGYGVRNTHRTAVAPNTSSALLCGGTSQGIEPVVANIYIQPTSAGEIYRVNPLLLNLVKERLGDWPDHIVRQIMDDNGSVRTLDCLSDHEKMVFRTAYEEDQEVILRLASARQKYICQAQSINLFFDSEEEESYIAHIHKLAFKDKNIKSLYYMRTMAGVSASKGECLACEG